MNLKQEKKEIDELKSERTVMKSWVSDVNSLLSNLLEAHDPIFIITIRRHLADKLRPAIALLNRLKGVREAHVPPKQGGDGKDAKAGEKQKIDKGKQPMGEDEEDDEYEEDKLKIKARDLELNKNARIAR